ncbi:MFS transporter [Rhizorhabdus dicambivorans]|uniref:MFS transporter n=1 Tax=Rhizorhabdus dicambivorans TaxID=1850238 RepID=A0A2A4FVF0_9SPHN|nr:MFS transporter [Rhizorhabdus dicambivorans]ATE63573.1 MFS transporter [Rhizorhabdus dicambivorans]PCE41371.1 MFS transporter [Rhizorhabdus dicambivorans]
MLHRRASGQRYAFVVMTVTFVALLVSAALRSAPSVLMLPLEAHFGWDRATISLAAAIGIFLYGLAGPFAAGMMQTMGLRRTMIGGLAMMAASTLASLWMTQSWHYVLTWGLISGAGSGAIAPVLGATIVNRWFAARRGLMMGLLTASTATGSLLFLPAMAWLTRNGAWTPVALAVGIGAAALIPIVWLLMPESPAAIGTTRYGEKPGTAPSNSPGGGATLAITTLVEGMRTPIFWMLFGTFLVCGLTTNGLVGTHLIAYCGDNGIAPVQAAGLLSLMGLFDLIGTTASGWLTDRYDPRKLLFVYYGLRGLSLLALPALDFQPGGLLLFAAFYGLDWVATVPPTVALANRHFGEARAPIIFGWVLTGHQIGAALAAFGAGLIREQTGSYTLAFILAGAFGLLAAFAAVSFARKAPAYGAVSA